MSVNSNICYKIFSTPSRLFIVRGTEITSKEGSYVTQVDPVSMTIYGIGVPPLITMVIGILSNEYGPDANVMADAGDFSTAGNLRNVRRWWSALKETGPKFGYNPEPTKS